MNSNLLNSIASTFFIFIISATTIVCQTNNEANKTINSKLPRIEHFETPQVFQYKPENLPAPYQTQSTTRPSKQVVQPENAILRLPKGFQINVFAEGGFRYPRWMALAPNGDVFVADSRANSIIILRDKKKDGVAEERFIF